MTRSADPAPDALDTRGEITLGLLDAVDADQSASQRTLANQLGIALGLTNAYLKRCIRRGWIKVKQAPPNRYAYYLTPTGFAEKSRLTTQYLARSLTFYRQARSQFEALFAQAVARNARRVVLVGAGELAEIAQLCATQYPVEIVAILDVRVKNEDGIPVVTVPRDVSWDIAVITALQRPQVVYRDLVALVPAERVVWPALLKITPGNGARHGR